MEAEIKYLAVVKGFAHEGIEKAFARAGGFGTTASDAWCDLAATVKAHGRYSMVAADKALNAKGWAELIDETIARLAPVAV